MQIKVYGFIGLHLDGIKLFHELITWQVFGQ
jgi:hypothetical protein